MNFGRATAARRRIGVRCLALPLLLLGGVPLLVSAQEKGATTVASTVPSPRVAGTIELAAGDAMIESSDGKARLPKVGDTLSEGETIVTFPQGELHVHMEDGAYLSVRENTRLKIAAYVAEGGKNDTSVLELVRGSLRSVTGWIGKFNRSAYQIKTPTATIGVRGTDHEPTVIAAGDPRGEAGTYDKVNEGRTVLQTGPHAVEVGANQAAFQASSGAARPRVLPSVPAFFKPTPNEQRFVARSREVRETLDTRRIDRREAVRRGPDGRREPPSKAAPASTRSGAPSHSVGPGAAATREPSPSLHGSKAAPGGPAEKRAGSEGRAGSAAPRSGRPPGSSSVPATSDGSKGPSQHGRAVELDNARAGRPNAKQHEETGERRAPQGATGHKK
jgi:hypothetical protein